MSEVLLKVVFKNLKKYPEIGDYVTLYSIISDEIIESDYDINTLLEMCSYKHTLANKSNLSNTRVVFKIIDIKISDDIYFILDGVDKPIKVKDVDCQVVEHYLTRSNVDVLNDNYNVVDDLYAIRLNDIPKALNIDIFINIFKFENMVLYIKDDNIVDYLTQKWMLCTLEDLGVDVNPNIAKIIEKRDLFKLPEDQRKVIAIDFDGTITKRDSDFPNIGEFNEDAVLVCNALQNLGHDIVMWTLRENELLRHASLACLNENLIFDAYNQNVDWKMKKYNNNPRKIGYDILIDDRNVGGFIGWKAVWEKITDIPFENLIKYV